jgi:hypothetical protein
MTQGILYDLLHLAECGIAVDGTIRLHADAAELIGKRKVFVQLCFAELCQFFQCHAVTFQLPQKRNSVKLLQILKNMIMMSILLNITQVKRWHNF